MRLVPPHKLHGGHRCAITGRSQDPIGFIETGFVLTGVDPVVELSAAAVKEAARLCGSVPEEEVQEVQDEAEAREHALLEYADELEAEIVRLNEKAGVREAVIMATDGDYTVDPEGKLVAV